ncbi:CBS domain-containing protein [Candidatus Woesearchaeota archaeon]|nr:CBS domain-containing protein [Candidatus Woesearchaeota archaeon]
MSKPVITILKDSSMFDAVKLMDKHNIGCIAVVEKERPIGILTERDIIRRVVAKEKNLKQTKVADIMTKNPVTVNSEASILEVTRIMSENNFRRVLVVKNDKLVGLVTAKDIIGLTST